MNKKLWLMLLAGLAFSEQASAGTWIHRGKLHCYVNSPGEMAESIQVGFPIITIMSCYVDPLS